MNVGVFLRTRGRRLHIEMMVRPGAGAGDGLLFWTSEEEMTPYSDYLAIGLRDGFAQLGYNLGSGEALLVSNRSRIDDDRWHRIRVRRYLQQFALLCVEASSELCLSVER